MTEATIRDGVLQVGAPGTRWLSTGWDGGFVAADAAYLLSVPAGWDRTDLHEYVGARRRRSRFDADGPSLLTAVDIEHARGARCGPVEVYATAGVSNPAALPMDPAPRRSSTSDEPNGREPRVGTVNLLVVTDVALDDGAVASLLGVVVEAKAATLLAETGVPGTTTDAVVVGCDPSGESERFAGSGTSTGGSARACARDAVRASLRSHYPNGEIPGSVDEAPYGTVTARRPEVFRVSEA